MNMLCSLKQCEQVSKKSGNVYQFTRIELKDKELDVVVVIDDYKCQIPLDIDGIDVELKCNDGRYYIETLGYYVPFQYNLALNLLFIKKGGNK